MPKLRNLVLIGLGLAAGRKVYRSWRGDLGIEDPNALSKLALGLLTNALGGARRTMQRFITDRSGGAPFGDRTRGETPSRTDSAFSSEAPTAGAAVTAEDDRCCDHDLLTRFHQDEDHVFEVDDELPRRTVFATSGDDDLEGDVLVGDGMDRSLMEDEQGIDENGGPMYSAELEDAARNDPDVTRIDDRGPMYSAEREDAARNDPDETAIDDRGPT